MKRLWIPVLTLLLTVTMLLTVSAAGAAYMQLSSSASTLYRGDSFTVTVSLSNDQPISNGGVMLSYDTAALEMVSGSCQVSGAAVSNVSSANRGGTFAMEQDAVVSGTIFTFQMRVKDNAGFGSYTISGSPALNISCSLGGTSVTVACRHNYQNCTSADSKQHKSTCTVCGDVKTEVHSWNSGTVTKAPTCKDTGMKKLTCTGCKTTKDEPVPASNDHKYGSWSEKSSSQHSRICSVCQKTDTASHTWNSGTVTKAPTCTATGTKKLTCTGCKATKTETMGKTAHDYTDQSLSDTQHKRTCTDCGDTVTEAHSFGDWEHDGNWHWIACRICGHKAEQTAHSPGPKATETTDQICTVCNRILKPKGAHVHSFSESWTTDDTGHWHSCSDCSEADSAAPHSFDSDCDSSCDTCGFTREPLHPLAEDWYSDESGHWKFCTACGEKASVSGHEPGAPATVTSAQLCQTCGYEIAPVLPHDHVFDADGTTHRHACACGELYEATAEDCTVCAGFPWLYVCIGEAVLIVVLVIFLSLKKRKDQ